MRHDTEFLASPFDRRRVFAGGGAVLILGNSLGLVCHGPSVSDQKSTESSSTQTQTATDQGVVVSGGTNVAPGAAATGGADSPIVGGAQVIGGTGAITITTADAATIEKALESVTHLAGGYGEQFAGIQANQQANLSSVLGSIAALAESKQTEGASAMNKNILWIVLGLFAAVVLGIWAFRRA